MNVADNESSKPVEAGADTDNVEVSTGIDAEENNNVGGDTDASPSTGSTAPPVEEKELAQPKRPLSAYNYFFRSERARLVGVDLDLKEIADVHNRKKRRHRKTHGKMGFREMANKVGERWRKLSDEEKAPFVKMFEDDRARYKAELKVWNDLQKEKKRENARREKEAIKAAKAEEKKRKKLEKKKKDEKEKAERLAASAVEAKVVEPDEQEVEDDGDPDGMDDIINKALNILNGEDVLAVSAATNATKNEVDDGDDATADYINRAMDMLNEDIPNDLAKPSRKRSRDSSNTRMLKNSMSRNTVMDFDRFLVDFDDERFVSDDSSAGEDNEDALQRRVKAKLSGRHGGVEDGFFDGGIEPLSVSQMGTQFNALENDLNNVGRGGWGNPYAQSMQSHLPLHLMHLQS